MPDLEKMPSRAVELTNVILQDWSDISNIVVPVLEHKKRLELVEVILKLVEHRLDFFKLPSE